MASSPTVEDKLPIVAPDQVPLIIEADEDFDSTFGSDGGSSYNYGSITSSIYDYKQENGLVLSKCENLVWDFSHRCILTEGHIMLILMANTWFQMTK